MASKVAREAIRKLHDRHNFTGCYYKEDFEPLAAIIDDALREEREAAEAMNVALFQCVEMLHYGRGYPDTVARAQAALTAYREAMVEGAAT
jgi:hypothetical protein